MASAGTSRFVHCMEKLNADIWADVLLPMLRKDKSAAAVAASCSTLRKLCQGAVRHLIFTPAARSGDLATVKRNVAALHQHFSALKGVGIALARDDLYVLAPAIMEGLSRLSCLCNLELQIAGDSSLALAMVLSSINTQLPQLRSLTLTARHSWIGAQAVWEQLGEATQLTELAIRFHKTVDVGGQVKDLAPLSSLSGLQQLKFRLINNAEQLQLDGVEASDAGFLSHLTSLTELCGDFVQKPGMLENIGSCADLQELALTGDILVQPSSSDWQVLGSLTSLTQLLVSRGMLRDQDTQPFHSALERLTSLQAVTTGYWTQGAVPILAALTKLIYVGGAWAAEDRVWDGDAAYTCERVAKVVWGEDNASAPWSAFPNLLPVNLAGPMTAASWVEMVKYCPKVKQIIHCVDPLPNARPNMPAFTRTATIPESVAALKGLARLTDLVHLCYCVSHKLEIVALAAAMQRVTGLKVLGVALRAHPLLDWGCLPPLCQLKSVVLADFTVRVPLPSKHEAQMLYAFAHASDVTLAVGAADVAVVEEAVQDSRDMGLALPGNVTVVPVPE